MHLQYSANIPIPTIWLKALPKGNNKKIYTYLKFSHMHLIYIVKTHSVSFFVKVVYITNIIFFFSFFFLLYICTATVIWGAPVAKTVQRNVIKGMANIKDE